MTLDQAQARPSSPRDKTRPHHFSLHIFLDFFCCVLAIFSNFVCIMIGDGWFLVTVFIFCLFASWFISSVLPCLSSWFFFIGFYALCCLLQLTRHVEECVAKFTLHFVWIFLCCILTSFSNFLWHCSWPWMILHHGWLYFVCLLACGLVSVLPCFGSCLLF